MTTQTVGADPSEVDIRLVAGEPVDFTVPVLDSDNVAQSAAGWSAVAQVRRHPGAPLLAELTVAPGTSGVRVSATGAQTATWAAWGHQVTRWDLWVTPPADESRPLCAGHVFVRSPTSEVS